MTFKELLKEKDMTASRLSRAIGVTKWTVGNWIHGTSMPRNAWTLVNIAKALDVDLKTLTDTFIQSNKKEA